MISLDKMLHIIIISNGIRENVVSYLLGLVSSPKYSLSFPCQIFGFYFLVIVIPFLYYGSHNRYWIKCSLLQTNKSTLHFNCIFIFKIDDLRNYLFEKDFCL